MSRYGKCQNFSGCLLAYRGEETELDDDQPFICAECGKPLAEVRSPSAMWMRYVYALGGALVLAVVVVLAVPSLRGKVFGSKKEVAITEEQRSSSGDTGEATPEVTPGGGSVATVPDGSAQAAEPPRAMVAPARIDLDASRGENKAVKAEVLTRVDLMPNVTSANKDRLYSAVERAQSMGKVLTIPFGSGKTELAAADIEALKAELEKPDLARLLNEPTAVFVILGYADPKGDAKKNLIISQARADAVLKALRDKLNVINVMHTVAMGGSKLLDAENLEKNRIVELWAVQP